MYLFGGSKGNSDANDAMYTLDLRSYLWEKLIPQGDAPLSRDEHTCNIYGASMIIFGGFVNGIRTNDVL